MKRICLRVCATTVALATLSVFQHTFASELTVVSPDGSLQVVFAIRDGEPTYSISRRGETLIHPSKLGFRLADAPPLDKHFAVLTSQQRSVSETWEQPETE